MQNFEANNGRWGTENSPTQNISGIQSPANNAYRNSLLIAAISKFMGHEGLVSPVTDNREGVQYVFDFFCPESKHLFKVLRVSEIDQYGKYAAHPGIRSIIIEAEEADEDVRECEVLGRPHIALSPTLSRQIEDRDYTCIFFDGELWEFERDATLDVSFWSPMVPVVIREMEEVPEA